MRNIEASEWLADPELQIVETRAAGTAGGSSFTLFANQRSRVTAEDAAGDAGNKEAAQ